MLSYIFQCFYLLTICENLIGGRKIFRDFLRCEYSEENILFWLACEELKQETNPEAIEEKARYIYEDYISILSPKEVFIFQNQTNLRTKLFDFFVNF
jgi:Regulator of G protein signaling domain